MDHQGPQRLVEQLDIVGAGALDLNGFRRVIQQESGFAFYFLHDIAAGFHRNFDEPRLVRSELAIGLSDDGAIRSGDTNHHVAQRLLRGGGHLLDHEISNGLVIEVDALVVVRVDHDSLALSVFVDQIARNTGNFCKYQCAGHPGNVDLAR